MSIEYKVKEIQDVKDTISEVEINIENVITTSKSFKDLEYELQKEINRLNNKISLITIEKNKLESKLADITLDVNDYILSVKEK